MKTAIQQNCVGEWSFESERPLAVVFDGPEGRQWQVPAFWVNGPPWQETYRPPGAAQVALGAAFLRRFAWWRFEPHPEWGEPAGSGDNVVGLFVAGIPREVRLAYSYSVMQPGGRPPKRILGIEKDVVYHARYFDPRTGTEHPLGEVRGDVDGAWTLPLTPQTKDYVVALEATR